MDYFSSACEGCRFAKKGLRAKSLLTDTPIEERFQLASFINILPMMTLEPFYRCLLQNNREKGLFESCEVVEERQTALLEDAKILGLPIVNILTSQFTQF